MTFFFLLTTKLSICLPLDTSLSLSGHGGTTLNADYCSPHSSPGPAPAHSVIIQLFLDKPTQINIYSCLQVRGLNEPQGGQCGINYVSTNEGLIKRGRSELLGFEL